MSAPSLLTLLPLVSLFVRAIRMGALVPALLLAGRAAVSISPGI